MLQIQALGYFLKDRQIFVKYRLLFLSWLYKALTDSQISAVVWRSRGSRSPKTFYNTNTIFIFYRFYNRFQISSKLHIKTIIYLPLQNKTTPPCFFLIDTQRSSLVSSLSLFSSTTLSQSHTWVGGLIEGCLLTTCSTRAGPIRGGG